MLFLKNSKSNNYLTSLIDSQIIKSHLLSFEVDKYLLVIGLIYKMYNHTVCTNFTC